MTSQEYSCATNLRSKVTKPDVICNTLKSIGNIISIYRKLKITKRSPIYILSAMWIKCNNVQFDSTFQDSSNLSECTIKMLHITTFKSNTLLGVCKMAETFLFQLDSVINKVKDCELTLNLFHLMKIFIFSD